VAAPACSAPSFPGCAGDAASWRARAEYWEGEARRLEAENGTLAGALAAQREQIAALKQQVVTLIATRGRTSE